VVWGRWRARWRAWCGGRWHTPCDVGEDGLASGCRTRGGPVLTPLSPGELGRCGSSSDSAEVSPLSNAVRAGGVSCMELLLQNGADVAGTDSQVRDPFWSNLSCSKLSFWSKSEGESPTWRRHASVDGASCEKRSPYAPQPLIPNTHHTPPRGAR